MHLVLFLKVKKKKIPYNLGKTLLQKKDSIFFSMVLQVSSSNKITSMLMSTVVYTIKKTFSFPCNQHRSLNLKVIFVVFLQFFVFIQAKTSLATRIFNFIKPDAVWTFNFQHSINATGAVDKAIR